jgi:hypothetical protein
MISQKKVRLLRHKQQQEAAKELARKKRFAKQHGLIVNSKGEYACASRSEFQTLKTRTDVYRRETQYVPSLDTGAGVAAKSESTKYTGTLVKGIATMHKSNAVPVIDQEQAKEISRMRRG